MRRAGRSRNQPEIFNHRFKVQINFAANRRSVYRAASIAQSVIPESLQSGLVAYYPFNGNTNDASGNGNHGTVAGAVPANDRFGNANSAYGFDGVNDLVSIPNSTSLNISDNHAMSVALWA